MQKRSASFLFKANTQTLGIFHQTINKENYRNIKELQKLE